MHQVSGDLVPRSCFVFLSSKPSKRDMRTRSGLWLGGKMVNNIVYIHCRHSLFDLNNVSTLNMSVV